MSDNRSTAGSETDPPCQSKYISHTEPPSNTNPSIKSETQSILQLRCLTNFPHGIPSRLGSEHLPKRNREPEFTAAAPRLRQESLCLSLRMLPGPQLGPRLKCSSMVPLVLSNSHCWLGEEGSHVFMKTRRSLGLQSIQLMLTE